jgi:hypothetical protein
MEGGVWYAFSESAYTKEIVHLSTCTIGHTICVALAQPPPSSLKVRIPVTIAEKSVHSWRPEHVIDFWVVAPILAL